MTAASAPMPRALSGPGLSGVPVKLEQTEWSGTLQLALDVPPERARKAPRRAPTPSVAPDYTARVLEAVGPVWRALSAEYTGRALYVTWAQHCRGPLRQWSRVKLRPEERRPVSLALAGQGMSARGISLLLGVADQTIRADLGTSVKTVKTDIRDRSGKTGVWCEGCMSDMSDSPQDGRSVPAAHRQAASVTGDMAVKTLRVLAMLAMLPDGLTAEELEYATGWNHGIASGTCTRLGQQGKVACSITRRKDRVVYVIVS